jgi:hypothetical protein
VSARTIQYAFTVTSGERLVGAGSMITACAVRQPDKLRSVEIPADVVPRLRSAAGQTDGD